MVHDLVSTSPFSVATVMVALRAVVLGLAVKLILISADPVPLPALRAKSALEDTAVHATSAEASMLKVASVALEPTLSTVVLTENVGTVTTSGFLYN